METGLQLGLEECVGFGQPEGGSMDFSGQDPIPFFLPNASRVSSSELRTKPGCECLQGFRPEDSGHLSC